MTHNDKHLRWSKQLLGAALLVTNLR